MRHALALMLLVSPGFASEPPSKEQIARWVGQLGDDRFAVREEASKRLWEAGEAAETALYEALKNPDIEVARRARALVDQFRWGLYPSTPPKIVEMIHRYRRADESEKPNIIKELFDQGSPGCKALLKIADAEAPEVRPKVFQRIPTDVSLAVPRLLQEGNLPLLEQMLELAMAAEKEAAIADYAACCLIEGKLSERIAQFKVRAERGNSSRAGEVLVYLHRAAGDLTSARQAAARIGRPDLEVAILREAGDWPALAAFDLDTVYRSRIEALGFKAAFQRLAGHQADFEETIKLIRAHPKPMAEGDRDTWLAAKALLLNDRPTDALVLLVRNQPVTAFEILALQLRFREALALVDKARAAHSPELPLLEVLQARTLHQLGEREKAAKLFDDLASRIQYGAEASWHDKLVEAEWRVGRKDQAFEHGARVLAVSKSRGRDIRLLGQYFPGKGRMAAEWWKFLRSKSPTEPPPTTMSRLRGILAGKVRGTALDSLVGSAKVLHPDTQAARWMVSVAEVYLVAGMEERAREYLDAAVSSYVSPEPQIHFGDYLVEQKKWEQAANRYRQAWEINRKEPLPLFLQGWALAQAGREEEGKRLMELAHELPLGDESARFAFATELAKRRHREAARREGELLLRVSIPGSFYAGEGFRQLALDAFHRKDYLQAAANHEQALLRCLKSQTGFLETAAYLAVPHFIHRHRARGLIAAGKLDDALREAEFCLTGMPGNSDLATLLLPALESRGHAKEADVIFSRCREPHVQLCREYPNSAWAHNSLAWLCASTRRQLDEGLEHAQKAVTLDPGNAGYHDTLAEVYFQRGDRDKALAESKTSIRLDGQRRYFRKQLARIEAGDPKADLPPSSDEE